MKIFLMFLLLMAGTAAWAGEIEIKVSGMVCSMCAQGIQKKFKAHSEIKSLKVDLDQKLVQLSTHEGKDLSDQLITKIITEAGYNVASIKRN